MNEIVEIVNGKKIYKARKAVVVYDNKILLLKINIDGVQLGHKPELGNWEVPGGRMQIGDNDEDTLKREVKEEAGINIIVEREINEFEFYPRGDVIIKAKCFLCKALSGDVILEDPEHQHESFKWVTLNEALNYDIPVWLKDAIKLLK